MLQFIVSAYSAETDALEAEGRIEEAHRLANEKVELQLKQVGCRFFIRIERQSVSQGRGAWHGPCVEAGAEPTASIRRLRSSWSWVAAPRA